MIYPEGIEDEKDKGNGTIECGCVCTKYCLGWSVLTIVILFSISFVIYSSPIKDSDLYPVVSIVDGARIQLKSDVINKFVRVSSSSDNELVLTESIAWSHGSTLKVQRVGECFNLQGSNGKYVRMSKEDSKLSADSETKSTASKFVAVASDLLIPTEALYTPYSILKPLEYIFFYFKSESESDEQKNRQLSKKHNNQRVMLKLCQEEIWLSLGSRGTIDASEPAIGIFGSSAIVRNEIRATTETQGENKRMSRQHAQAENWYAGEPGQDGSIFELIVPPQKRGVNLGGWFIPEVWMNYEFFAGSGLGWGGSLCGMRKWDRAVTERRMDVHLREWITEDDFRLIKEYGFNSVRLPVGYWNVIQDPYDLYSPSDVKDSLHYIDWAFDMANKYGLTVLLNIHGGAGSQNGIDHSGCAIPPAFLNATIMDSKLSSNANTQLTLNAIEAMTKRYGNHPNLEGFGLLNEPNLDYSEYNHDELRAFYESAYDIIRKYSTTQVVFNELYEDCWKKWRTDLIEPRFYNVVLDVHLYNWQAPVKEQESTYAHLKDAREWGRWIEDLATQYPVVVGEWCMSTGTIRQVGQSFVDEEVNSFRGAQGWYIWNWRIERDIGFDTWDVKYQYENKLLNPLHIYQNGQKLRKER